MRTLGLDYGSKRLGFAVSDEGGMIATPLRVVTVRSRAEALRRICEMCDETGAERLVVGLPLNMDGTFGPAARGVEMLVEELRAMPEWDVEIAFWDERLTTATAERMLVEHDVSRGKRKRLRDKIAAQIILQSYLDREHVGRAEGWD